MLHLSCTVSLVLSKEDCIYAYLTGEWCLYMWTMIYVLFANGILL